MREYSKDEVQKQYLELIWSYIDYWHNLPNKTCREKMEGLAFGIMVILDGESALPGCIVVPCPHPDDRKYHEDQDENWFPENHELSVNCDIAGSLHERFHNIRRKETHYDKPDS